MRLATSQESPRLKGRENPVTPEAGARRVYAGPPKIQAAISMKLLQAIYESARLDAFFREESHHG